MKTVTTQSALPQTSLVIDQIVGYGIDEEKANGFLLFLQEYQALLDKIESQEAIVAEWEKKPRCYGTKSFKNKVYLHINHSPVQYRDLGPCPHCGWGDDTNKRHYPYVGKDPVRQDEAVIAMKNWEHWQEQKIKLAKLRTKLQRMDRAMTSLLSNISTQRSLL